jgi:drug/metabolite transporter (DMT)-like permease
MRKALTNTTLIILSVSLLSVFSLAYSVFKSDVEWFQASGAVVTIGGVILAARKIIRLGIEKFMRDEQTIDGGNFKPTSEEVEAEQQFKKDINSYKWSIALLIVGTLVWAYGGILLRICCIKA